MSFRFDEPAYPPCPPDFNLSEHVLAASQSVPEKIALMIVTAGGAERWSYARLEAAVLGCGTGLLSRGLVPGDRILMRLGNTPAFPALLLGAIAAGLVPVPTSAALTKAEITRLAGIIGPALIVADDGIALPDHPAPVMTSSQILKMERLSPCAYSRGDPNRLAYVVFTSGTSGNPLAVGHAHRAIWARRTMHRGWEGLRESDRLLHAGAMNWTFTLGTGLLDPWTLCATALVPGPGVSPLQLPLLLKRYDTTIFAGAPGVVRQMLKQPPPKLPHLRHGLTAGESLAPALRRQWQVTTGTDLHEAMGMSECSTYLSGSPDRPAPDGCIGYVQPGRRVRILSDGQPVAEGTPGEIAIHRDDPGLMIGYLGVSAATDMRFAGDWFLTGDLGQADPDGAIRYLGRNDDQMNVGGYRVSPVEVEAVLSDAAGIIDLAVTAVEVKPGVSVVGCAYVADQDYAAELASLAGNLLATWKQPRIYRRLPALPRGANHKVNRRAISKELGAEL